MALTTLFRCPSCSWSWGMNAPLSLVRGSEYQRIRHCRSCGRIAAQFRAPEVEPWPHHCGHCGSVNTMSLVSCPICDELLEWVPGSEGAGNSEDSRSAGLEVSGYQRLYCGICTWSWGPVSVLRSVPGGPSQQILHCRACDLVQARVLNRGELPDTLACSRCRAVALVYLGCCPECGGMYTWLSG